MHWLFCKIIQYHYTTVIWCCVVHIGLLCTDRNTIHTLSHKRPVFINPPNFQKMNYGGLPRVDLYYIKMASLWLIFCLLQFWLKLSSVVNCIGILSELRKQQIAPCGASMAFDLLVILPLCGILQAKPNRWHDECISSSAEWILWHDSRRQTNPNCFIYGS